MALPSSRANIYNLQILPICWYVRMQETAVFIFHYVMLVV